MMIKLLQKCSEKGYTVGYKCQYCNKEFAKESTLFKHVCEQKRRALAKSEKHVIIGYQAFVKFFEFTQNNANTPKTYEEFAKSPYYNGFVKFGSYVSNVNPLYPEKYIGWVVRSGEKLDKWCNDALYEKYVVTLIHHESVETALERGITHMNGWGATTKNEWFRYFELVTTSRAMYDIKDGKISPWILLNCASGRALLATFRDDQLLEIKNIIDPQTWQRKFKDRKADVELVKQVIGAANL